MTDKRQILVDMCKQYRYSEDYLQSIYSEIVVIQLSGKHAQSYSSVQGSGTPQDEKHIKNIIRMDELKKEGKYYEEFRNFFESKILQPILKQSILVYEAVQQCYIERKQLKVYAEQEGIAVKTVSRALDEVIEIVLTDEVIQQYLDKNMENQYEKQ